MTGSLSLSSQAHAAAAEAARRATEEANRRAAREAARRSAEAGARHQAAPLAAKPALAPDMPALAGKTPFSRAVTAELEPLPWPAEPQAGPPSSTLKKVLGKLGGSLVEALKSLVDPGACYAPGGCGAYETWYGMSKQKNYGQTADALVAGEDVTINGKTLPAPDGQTREKVKRDAAAEAEKQAEEWAAEQDPPVEVGSGAYQDKQRALEQKIGRALMVQVALCQEAAKAAGGTYDYGSPSPWSDETGGGMNEAGRRDLEKYGYANSVSNIELSLAGMLARMTGKTQTEVLTARWDAAKEEGEVVTVSLSDPDSPDGEAHQWTYRGTTEDGKIKLSGGPDGETVYLSPEEFEARLTSAPVTEADGVATGCTIPVGSGRGGRGG